MNPINYNIDVKNPVEGVVQGLQTGFGIQNAFAQRDAQQMAMEQAQQQQIQQQQLQQELATVSQNPTPSAIAKLSIKYPQLSEQFKRSFDMQSAEQKQSKIDRASQVYNALLSGNTDIAKQLLGDTAAAYRNSGMENEAKSNEVLAEIIDRNPKTALLIGGNFLANAMGPDQFAAAFKNIEEARRGNALFPAEQTKAEAEATIKGAEAENIGDKLSTENALKTAQIKDINSQIVDRGARIGLDRDKLTSDVQMKMMEFNTNASKLDPDARKLVNDAVTNSVTNEQTANQMEDLASQFEKAGGWQGSAGSMGEWFKNKTGNQNALSDLRKDYVRLRSTQVAKLLPPGPASDTDIRNAMAGFPEESADFKSIASFLRGMSKLTQISAINDNARAEWVGSVGSLGKPKSEIIVDGVKVPAGTNYTDFARAYLQAKTEQRMIETRQQQIKNGNASYLTGGNNGSAQ